MSYAPEGGGGTAAHHQTAAGAKDRDGVGGQTSGQTSSQHRIPAGAATGEEDPWAGRVKQGSKFGQFGLLLQEDDARAHFDHTEPTGWSNEPTGLFRPIPTGGTRSGRDGRDGGSDPVVPAEGTRRGRDGRDGGSDPVIISEARVDENYFQLSHVPQVSLSETDRRRARDGETE